MATPPPIDRASRYGDDVIDWRTGVAPGCFLQARAVSSTGAASDSRLQQDRTRLSSLHASAGRCRVLQQFPLEATGTSAPGHRWQTKASISMGGLNEEILGLGLPRGNGASRLSHRIRRHRAAQRRVRIRARR